MSIFSVYILFTPIIYPVYLSFIPIHTYRPGNLETNNCPLIPLIILSTGNENKDLHNHLEVAGGASRILLPPHSAKTILFTVVDLLQRRQVVEDTFNDLTKVTTGSEIFSLSDPVTS